MKISFEIDVEQDGERHPGGQFFLIGEPRPLSTEPSGLKAAPGIRKSPEIGLCLESGHTTSNRHNDENRCYRKRRTKALLTGTRTSINDFRVFAMLSRQAYLKCGDSAHTSVLYPTLESNPSASLAKCKST
jgi:hypothetical protein